jgi:hypothetical protein
MKFRGPLIKLCVPLAAVALTLLALEAGIRVWRAAGGLFKPQAQGQSRPLPLHVLTQAPYLYGLNPLHPDISEQGTRDEAVVVPKPAGAFRVLVLGDSLAYGAAVAREETFPNQLEALLRERGARAEVVNAGVSGYTAYNELQFYLSEGRKFQADVVVVAFCLNDAVNPRLHWGDAPGVRIPEAAIPNAAYDREHILPRLARGTSRAPGRKEESALGALLRRSELYRAIEPAIKGMFRRGDEELAHNASGVPVYLTAEDSISIETLLGDTPEWAWLTNIYDQLNEAVRKDNARLVIVLFPLAYQLDENYPFFPQKRLAAYCQQRGIDCLDLLSPFAAHGKASVFMLNNSGYYDVWHLNRRGHRVAAEELLRFMSEKGLLAGEGSAARR